MAGQARNCSAQLWSQTRMEVKGGKRKEPSLGPGHLQLAGPWGRCRTGRLHTPNLPWQSWSPFLLQLRLLSMSS